MSETAFMDSGVSKDCINPDSFGMICVKCNACGRFGKNTMWKCRYHMYWDRIFEQMERHDAEGFRSNIQQANIAKNIIYNGKKLLECVSHIDFDAKKEE